MLVYRLCNKAELNKLLKDKSFINIGRKCTKNKKLNNFDYSNDIKYIHFFKNKSDILYLNSVKNRIICTYQIPDDILSKYQGIGLYLDYINYKDIVNVIEYAIPNYLININYIDTLELINETIDYDTEYSTNNITEDVKKIFKIKN